MCSLPARLTASEPGARFRPWRFPAPAPIGICVGPRVPICRCAPVPPVCLPRPGSLAPVCSVLPWVTALSLVFGPSFLSPLWRLDRSPLGLPNRALFPELPSAAVAAPGAPAIITPRPPPPRPRPGGSLAVPRPGSSPRRPPPPRAVPVSVRRANRFPPIRRVCPRPAGGLRGSPLAPFPPLSPFRPPCRPAFQWWR